MLGLLKEEHRMPKRVKDYEFIRSFGKPDGMSPKMAPDPWDRASNILKDSKRLWVSPEEGEWFEQAE